MPKRTTPFPPHDRAGRPTPRVRRRVVAWALVLLAATAAAPAQGSGPVADPPRGDMRIAVFGDFNGSYGALDYPAPVARAVDALTRVWRPDLLLSPGDVVAGQSHALPDAAFPAMWQAFDRQVAVPLRAAAIPYAVALGNHDGSSLRDGAGGFPFARERSAAAAYWGAAMYDANHAYVDRDRYPFDHAFRSGRVFVAVVDASSAGVTADQRAWLRDVLARPAATSADARIVLGHLPLLAVGVGRDRPGEVVHDAAALRRLLVDGGVDLYVSGHHAAYYPGSWGGLELLFAGGVGARRLLAGDAAPRSTVTLVDLWFEPLDLRYTTFDLATMDPVPAAALPPAITSGGGTVRLSERAHPRAAGVRR